MLYLKLYALGLPAMGIYNCGNGILSATGDTNRPLLYLTVAGVLNVILNLVFVIGCGMAAEGVAIASAIAQWVSALLIIIHLLHRKGRLPSGYPQAAAAPPGLQACAADRHPLRIAERYIRRG